MAAEYKSSLPGVARFLDKPLDKVLLASALDDILGRIPAPRRDKPASDPGRIPA